MNNLDNLAWRVLVWVLTLAPIVYVVLRFTGIVNYHEDGWRIYGLFVVALIAMTARKMLDE